VRYVRITLLGVSLGLVQLAVGWRVAVRGAAPDLLFVLAAVCARELRPTERIPVACAVGILSDFLLGGRLGLMALGYGLGAKLVEALTPLSARWRHLRIGGLVSRLAATALAAFAGAAAAHLIVAAGGALFVDEPGGAAARATRALGIALYTFAVVPVLWPLLAFGVGGAGRTASAGVVET
jgi:cell shape-determining protein MreD